MIIIVTSFYIREINSKRGPYWILSELRFKGFTDEWEQRNLGDEVRIVMGQSPNSENYTDDPNGR